MNYFPNTWTVKLICVHSIRLKRANREGEASMLVCRQKQFEVTGCPNYRKLFDETFDSILSLLEIFKSKGMLTD